MGTVRDRLVLSLLIFACALAGASAFVASARAEEGVATKEENPAAGEAVAEPVHQPVKETVEAAAPPVKEATAAAEPTTAPQTTTTSEATGTTSSGSSGAASATTATTPKTSGGSSATGTSTAHGGNGGNAGGGVQGASQTSGSTGSRGGTEISGAGGAGPDESEATGTFVEPGSESFGVTETEAAEPAEPAGGPTERAAQANGGAAPPPAVKLEDARPVETAPAPKPKPEASPSPLAAVGHVLSRPIKAGASLPAIPFTLIILLAAGLIGWFFWFDRESPSGAAAGFDGRDDEA